ncbi:MAG: membrane dipeptidase [Chitinophagaceae bacterium]|nr:membrane dipeptidase [Chitinophagaceae bacterium]
MLIIDAHLDLSMNALEWNRDLRLPVQAIRDREKNLTDKLDRGKGMVSLPALRKGNIGLVVATQIARYTAPGNPLPGWHSPQQAWAQTQGQLAWYKAMEEAGEMTMIKDAGVLEKHLALWQDPESPVQTKPIGYILSLEGADSLVDLSYLEKAYAYGLRAIGPAHYGPGRYAPGTGMTGPFTPQGLELLKEMERLNMILDITHLTDEAFLQAMEMYKGPVWASHHNCRALVHHQRQLTDDQIRMLIQRGAVIGGVLDAWMLSNDWVRGKSDPQTAGVDLQKLLEHYDHICQLAGNSRHIAIGSDLDGMFGKEQSPYDMEDIADLQRLGALLQQRGYTPDDITNVLHGNWLRFLRQAW